MKAFAYILAALTLVAAYLVTIWNVAKLADPYRDYAGAALAVTGFAICWAVNEALDRVGKLNSN